ncbi:hypothetical protein EDD11_002568 [Mortierella claussenii]|nr:hypothetical protein EDD11_002568 [Mortierella claussenii]
MVALPSTPPSSRLRVVPDDPFFRDTDTQRAWLLRGVNLSGSCKFPKYPVPVPSHVGGDAFLTYSTLSSPISSSSAQNMNSDDAEADETSRNAKARISFVGRPFELKEADEHLARLKHWGFRMIRWVVTWEAIEHQAPGVYDQEFLDYTVQALLKVKEHGFKVMIDFHQDVVMVQKMVDELDMEFSHEIMARQSQLQDTQALLRHATSELSETRRTIKQRRTQSVQLTEAQQKIKNLEQSLEEESQKTRSQKGYSGALRQKDGSHDDIDQLLSAQTARVGGGTGATDRASGTDGSPQGLKETEARVREEVLLLRARVLAYEQNEKELSQELVEIKGQSLEKELQCRKVISVCCNISLEKVDEMLVPLTLAVESDGASLDLSRVAGFMSKVKQQDAIASTPTPALLAA